MTERSTIRLIARAALIASTVPAVMGQAIAQEPPKQSVIGRTYAESVEAPWPGPVIARGKPNIIWILLDDVGFGAASAFGGPVNTPTIERLAADGLVYSNFHTTGVCSPTRAALLTGRNHNNVGMGAFPSRILGANFPGYDGVLKPEDGTVAEYLRDAGYSTYALGKWHLTPGPEGTILGPFDRWPSGKGFQHFYGFLGGATDQYKPGLIEDQRPVKTDGSHLNKLLVDKAISYIDEQRAISREKPFFMYFATGATHAPHQVDEAWIAKYRGKFDKGWDVVRQEIFARQKKMGIVPADAKLPPRNPRVEAWANLSAPQKKVYARFMEAFSGFLEYTDAELGRLVDHLEETGQLDNTMIYLIVGDNGGSRDGGPNGFIHGDMTMPSKDNAGQIEELVEHFDDLGTRRTESNYPIGWSQATNTPFRDWKGDANSEGGTRNPMILFAPGRVKHGVRTQYSHVIDMLPTTLEAVGIKTPAKVAGIEQTPVQGTSLAYSFDNAKAPTRHTTQYYYLFGSGAIVKDGWKASFQYRPDGLDTIFLTYPLPGKIPDNAGKEEWELYNLNSDFNEINDLAAKMPGKLAEMKQAFEREAQANKLYPLINWSDIWNRTNWKAFTEQTSVYDRPREDQK
ncbi:MAG: arylsulfatase [Novosphingobium sp.]|nr:arylsulfatase [Novosphingobium sp.]